MTDRFVTIDDCLNAQGISRRRFIQFCAMLTAVAPSSFALAQNRDPGQLASQIGASARPSVIWLNMEDCTGCTEALLHASAPDLATLLFSIISLDYHETLMAAAGNQADAILDQAIRGKKGKFILVVEGAIPTGEGSLHLTLLGRAAREVLNELSSQAALTVAIGSCASWGGIPSAAPNPTRAQSLDAILGNTASIKIPGCPPNPYNFLSVILEYVLQGHVPSLDPSGRPLSSYGRVIHDDCPRRGHFDAGRFASQFGDEAHRKGWCLYKLGCKGPVTHAPCSLRSFNSLPNCWPVGVGAPCFGCTEKNVAFTIPAYQTVELPLPVSIETLPPKGHPITRSALASAAAIGAIAATVGTLAVQAVRKLPAAEKKPPQTARSNKDEESEHEE
jgi:hydrogenase small subunit